MSASVVQFTDTHVVAPGDTYFGVDTARYLAAAIDAVHALPEAPAFVVVTGDLVQHGRAAEYERFRTIMARLAVPYFAIPGNHDVRETFRASLPPAAFGASADAPIRFAIDGFAIRLVGLDVTAPPPWPGAEISRDVLAWVDATLATDTRPTIVALHHPPFRSGLHYLDIFGFRGARALRRIVDRHPHVRRVIAGHIHTVKARRWRSAVASSGPSTAPQVVPELFERRVLGMRHERPGFAIHLAHDDGGFTTRVVRADGDGRYG